MTDNVIKKPEELEEGHLIYLDELRESGVTNMYGAGAYLQREFPGMDKILAREILSYWMNTFSQRHKNENE